MIKVSSLTHRYGDTLAVDEVSFEINSGEIVGLLGPNGAGKSTIMKILTGFLRPLEGWVELEGQNIWSRISASQAKIGYLPENNVLYEEMTVLDYLGYTAILRGVQENLLPSAIENALKKTDLAAKSNHTIGTLSKGFRQRVGVAQAILHQPKVLILDEPTNGLDPVQVQQMRRTIKGLSDNNTAVILSTHILKEVESVCDRVIVIKEGRKALDSKLDDLSGQGRFNVTVDKELEDFGTAVGPLAKFATLNFIEKNETGFQYTLTLKNETVVSEVARLIVEAGVGLSELSKEKRDLETIFNEI